MEPTWSDPFHTFLYDFAKRQCVIRARVDVDAMGMLMAHTFLLQFFAADGTWECNEDDVRLIEVTWCWSVKQLHIDDKEIKGRELPEHLERISAGWNATCPAWTLHREDKLIAIRHEEHLERPPLVSNASTITASSLLLLTELNFFLGLIAMDETQIPSYWHQILRSRLRGVCKSILESWTRPGRGCLPLADARLMLPSFHE